MRTKLSLICSRLPGWKPKGRAGAGLLEALVIPAWRREHGLTSETYACEAVTRHKGAGIFGSHMGAGKRYRLTEHLVIPEHWYDITGTCVENPEAKDEYDRNMIVKGTNEPTFLITWRSEKEIRRTLRNRAAQRIFGGAILAVVCLGIFLAKHGWLF